MTEAEWLNGWCYRRMYDVVRSQATTRQVRLYMVACCRLKAAEFFDGRIERALAAAERCADDPQAEAVADVVGAELATASYPRLPETGPEGELIRVIRDATQLLEECWDGPQYKDARHALTHAVFLCLRERPREVFTGGEGNAAEYCARAIDCAETLLMGAKPEDVEQEEQETEAEIRSVIAGLLRDVFGNPFRPVAFATDWRTPTAVSLAHSIYIERAFDLLPILADALEDAGCTDAAILDHCRGPGPHVRGCWVLDLLLGKE